MLVSCRGAPAPCPAQLRANFSRSHALPSARCVAARAQPLPRRHQQQQHGRGNNERQGGPDGVAANNRRLEALEYGLGMHTAWLTSINQRLESLEDLLAAQPKQLGGLEHGVAAQPKQLGGLEHGVAAHTKQLGSMHTRLASVERNTGALSEVAAPRKDDWPDMEAFLTGEDLLKAASIKGHPGCLTAMHDKLLKNNAGYHALRSLMRGDTEEWIGHECVSEEVGSWQEEEALWGQVLGLLKAARSAQTAAASEEEEEEEEEEERSKREAFYTVLLRYCEAAADEDSQAKLAAYLARKLQGGSDPALVLVAALCCQQLRLAVELGGGPLLEVTPDLTTLKLLAVVTSGGKVYKAVEQLEVAAQVLVWTMRTANPGLLAGRQLRVVGVVRFVGWFSADLRRVWDGKVRQLAPGYGGFNMEVKVEEEEEEEWWLEGTN